jgi:hypothetical protein
MHIDPKRDQFTSRSGSRRIKQHGDGQRRPPAPPRNSPCPCGSGKKAKRCHPDGLQPQVRRELQGTCQSCGAEGVLVVPIKHEGLPGWQLNVCSKCLRNPETFKTLAENAVHSRDGPEGATDGAGGGPLHAEATSNPGGNLETDNNGN